MMKAAVIPDDLTKNQRLVFDSLQREKGPMTAYRILDDLKPSGLRAPLQVYRALDKLIEMGAVHRLESLNSFVVCQHPECETHEASAFSICDTCGDVREYNNVRLDGFLSSLVESSEFQLEGSTIELRGHCLKCPEPKVPGKDTS